MAENTTRDAPPGMDIQEHEKTYRVFLFMTKWTAIVVVVILTGMAVFLL